MILKINGIGQFYTHFYVDLVVLQRIYRKYYANTEKYSDIIDVVQ